MQPNDERFFIMEMKYFPRTVDHEVQHDRSIA